MDLVLQNLYIEPDLLRINDSCLERVSKFKLLRVWQKDNLCWNNHVEQTVKKASKRLYFLRKCRKANLPTEIGITILYQNTPTSGICLPGVWRLAEAPCRSVAVYSKRVPRYHRDTKNIPSSVQCPVTGQVQLDR